MNLLKILPLVIIVFISGCAAQVSNPVQQPPVQEQPPQAPPQPPVENIQPEVTPQPPPQPTVKEFTIEADDRGFYMNNRDISSISVNKSETVKITFQVRTQNVYYGGLDFRGCGQSTSGTKPGNSVDMHFTADSTCTITSYWPSSGVMKDSMQVIVS